MPRDLSVTLKALCPKASFNDLPGPTVSIDTSAFGDNLICCATTDPMEKIKMNSVKNNLIII
jgi:hypothetical protein